MAFGVQAGGERIVVRKGEGREHWIHRRPCPAIAHTLEVREIEALQVIVAKAVERDQNQVWFVAMFRPIDASTRARAAARTACRWRSRRFNGTRTRRQDRRDVEEPSQSRIE